MKNLYREMVKLSIVIIFDKTGTALHTAGAKMMLRADGTIVNQANSDTVICMKIFSCWEEL